MLARLVTAGLLPTRVAWILGFPTRLPVGTGRSLLPRSVFTGSGLLAGLLQRLSGGLPLFRVAGVAGKIVQPIGRLARF